MISSGITTTNMSGNTSGNTSDSIANTLFCLSIKSWAKDIKEMKNNQKAIENQATNAIKLYGPLVMHNMNEQDIKQKVVDLITDAI